jgi:hypothetical protein
LMTANAKVSDGSQPPGASATPLGVPAGARSLDRLVRASSNLALPNLDSGELVLATTGLWIPEYMPKRIVCRRAECREAQFRPIINNIGYAQLLAISRIYAAHPQYFPR